ncbi:MAG: fructose-specific PTS transporter subunit EIIC [Negativicutes bacterium]|jgi:PTS system fructose-specific IIC component
MNLATVTNENLIFLDADWQTKQAVIENIAQAFFDNGILTDKQAYITAVFEREAIGETGLERGLAIPHGKSTAVAKAAFAVARLKTPLAEWESIDPDNKVQLVFMLAIPQSEAGGAHIDILAALSTQLLDEDFCAALMHAGSPEQAMTILSAQTSEKQQPLAADPAKTTILAITACAAGVAHTYMAAEALEKAGRAKGIRVVVEKQGANGIEDPISAADIRAASAIIFATDIAPKNTARFNGLPFVRTRVAEPLRNAAALLEKAINNPDGTVNETSQAGSSASQDDGFWQGLGKAILTGISYMIPVIVSAGIMIGLSKLLALPYGLSTEIAKPEYAQNPDGFIRLLYFSGMFGDMIFKFMYPVFAGFMAMAIADRPGFIAGFAGGAFAAGLHYVFWGIKGGIPSGFLGALILAMVAGYSARWLNRNVKLSKNLLPMKPMLIVPALSIVSVFLVNLYFVDPVFGAINLWLRELIMSTKGAGGFILPTVIAAATAFDLGGPVNKAAGAIAIGLAADKIYPLTARVLAIVIPPIGLGLATLIDKYVVRRRVFNKDLRVVGNTSLLLGFLAISEGGIPFMLANPLITIPINVIGAIIGANVAVAFGAVQWFPLPAIWGWPLVENFPAYALGLISGVLVIAFGNIFVRYYLLKKNPDGELE